MLTPYTSKREGRREDPNMNNGQWYIERNGEGDYSLKKGGAKRASAIEDTQEEAIKRAREIDAEAPIHVERQRRTGRGLPDKWRKP
jgi:uncharacterized protein YdaT